jgi:hypothetical protein
MTDFMRNRVSSVFENVWIAPKRYSSGIRPTLVRAAFDVHRGVQHNKYVFAFSNAAVSGQTCLGDFRSEPFGPICTP